MKELFEALLSICFSAMKDDSKLSQVAEDIIQNEEVFEKLKKFHAKTGADRLFIVQYHNGGNFFSGKSMQKASVTYEITSNGVSSEMRKNQNILTTEDPDYHIKLVKDRLVKYRTLSECKNAVKKHKLETRGVRSFYAFAITDINGNLIGYIAADFMDYHDMADDQILAYQELATLIAGYLLKPTTASHSKLQVLWLRASVILICLLAFAECLDIVAKIAKIFGF